MLETLRNAFKVKDIRQRIIFTFLMLIVIRIGSQLPVPGVNGDVFRSWFESQAAGLGFFDAITGGSFLSMSVFALNITPYITSSIIMQLLTIAIPKLEEMHKDGAEGRKKIAEITRYVTVGLALFEASAMTFGFWRSGYLVEKNALVRVLPYGSITIRQAGKERTDIKSLKNLGAFALTDDGVGVQAAGTMLEAMEEAAKFNIPIVAHCEDNSLIYGGVMHKGKRSKELGLKGIPSVSESVHIARDILLAEAAGAHYHVCHVSTKESVRVIRDAKKAGIHGVMNVSEKDDLITIHNLEDNTVSECDLCEFLGEEE